MRVLGCIAVCVVAAAVWFAMRDAETGAPARTPSGAEKPIPAPVPHLKPARDATTSERDKPEPIPDPAPQSPPKDEEPAPRVRELRGQVVDAATDRGVQSMVSAWHFDTSTSLGEEIATNADGRFVLKEIETDKELVIVARSDGFHPVRSAVITTESSVEEHKIRLGIGGVLEGTVLGAEGAPLPGCHVLLVRPGSSIHPESMALLDAIRLERLLTASTTTDENGRYRIRGVPLRQAWVAVARLGVDRDRETFREARSKEVRFAIDYARETRGLCFFDAANVTLRLWEENRTPVHKAQVELWKDNARHAPTTEAARDDGSWYWPEISPGVYTLKVFPPGAPFEEATVNLAPGESKSVEVTLDTAGVIEGQVIATDGAEPMHISLMWSGEKTVFGQADEDGKFRLTGVGTKRGTLSVDGYFNVENGTGSRDTKLRNVRPGGTGLRILLPPPPLVTGRLVGLPEAAKVSCAVESRNMTADSPLQLDEDGRFTIPARVKEPFMLLIKTKWRAPVRIDLHSLKAGETRDVGTIEMSKGRVIEVLVTDAAGKPIPGARVGSAVRWLEWRATTNSRGIAEMKMAPKGAVHIAVAANGHPLHCFRIAANRETVRLGPAGTLSGNFPTGERTYLTVRPSLPEERFDRDLDALTQRLRGDVEGRFEIALQPGRYRIHARGLDQPYIIEIRAGETTNLDLRKQ